MKTVKLTYFAVLSFGSRDANTFVTADILVAELFGENCWQEDFF